MKLFKILCIIIALALSNCTKVLDLHPLDKLTPEVLFSSPQGIAAYMANLYYQCPIEDFNFTTTYNQTGNTSGWIPAMLCDEAMHSGADPRIVGANTFPYWGYDFVRDLNQMLEIIPTLKNLQETDKVQLRGELKFMRAYAYFEMAKRYGGVPIITASQQWTGNVNALKVPRSKEKATWDFIMSECDSAIINLPEVNPSSDRRANKYAAYALKSRAALFAASVAKYWNNAPLTGLAVDQGLVGMQASDANGYYDQCIAASEAVISSGKYDLYMPNPASPKEAAKNYQAYFEDVNISPEESIFIKGFVGPTTPLNHNYDWWYNPRQTTAADFPDRCNVTLDLVDAYESYTNPGFDAPVLTSAAADELTNYNGFDENKNYYEWNNTTDIFANKDARLLASVIVPGSIWKKTQIIIQAGYVEPDGTVTIETKASTTVNGVTYYTYGAAAPTQFSGFLNDGGGNYTLTGFEMKKFLQEDINIIANWGQSYSDWVDFRYGEVLLNYAEAVVESGDAARVTKAATAMNATRRRAGHTVDIPLTLTNVLRERRVELAFENQRCWDLIRRRGFHEDFSGTVRHALKPLLDLRQNPPKYIFVRGVRSGEGLETFKPYYYYNMIPGAATNGLVQNPQY